MAVPAPTFGLWLHTIFWRAEAVTWYVIGRFAKQNFEIMWFLLLQILNWFRTHFTIIEVWFTWLVWCSPDPFCTEETHSYLERENLSDAWNSTTGYCILEDFSKMCEGGVLIIGVKYWKWLFKGLYHKSFDPFFFNWVQTKSQVSVLHFFVKFIFQRKSIF